MPASRALWFKAPSWLMRKRIEIFRLQRRQPEREDARVLAGGNREAAAPVPDQTMRGAQGDSGEGLPGVGGQFIRPGSRQPRRWGGNVILTDGQPNLSAVAHGN